MNKRYISFIFCLFSLLLWMQGCSTDNDFLAIETESALTLKVSSNGFASKADTRAAESGYATTFTADDKIGVFAQKDGVTDSRVSNLCLTAKNDGSGSLVWLDASGNSPLNIPQATYYAYYPWKEGLTTVPTSDTWTLPTNQSDYKDYTAADLMSATGIVNGKSLSFNMQHQMALVVIDLPRTKYSLSTDASYTWIADALGTQQFTGFSPCRMSDGTYRYLVKPDTDFTLSGSYTNASGTVEWVSTAQKIAVGNYTIFTVDGGSSTAIPKSHTLQADDYHIKDGSLVVKDEEFTDVQKTACIGTAALPNLER